jgi:signal transduction histidine kinase
MTTAPHATPVRVQDDAPPTASLADVDITRELDRRPRHASDFLREDRALATLAEAMATNPRAMLAQLVTVALDLCRADTAGLSLLEGDVFRWEAVAGVFASYQGGTMPRDASPCGVCIDRDTTQLMQLPDRCFPALKTEPRFVEALLVPFHRHGVPVGTVWVVSHGPERTFDREDERTIRALAAFAAAGYELWQAYEASAAASQVQERFLTTLGHEMRSPLGAIRSATTILQQVMASERPEVARALGTLDRQSQYLVRMADELLDLARFGHDTGALDLRSVDLHTVVDDAEAAVRMAIEARGQRLSIDRPVQPLPVRADARRLSQVLGNLLENARKYTPRGGQIWLTVERQGTSVRITVRDDGIGIAKEHFGLIFNLFSQVKDPDAPEIGGLGVGLYLVRTLTELHGGRVEVMSEGPGTGSRFTVILPLAD